MQNGSKRDPNDHKMPFLGMLVVGSLPRELFDSEFIMTSFNINTIIVGNINKIYLITQ